MLRRQHPLSLVIDGDAGRLQSEVQSDSGDGSKAGRRSHPPGLQKSHVSFVKHGRDGNGPDLGPYGPGRVVVIL
jgi:hypothetical protein